MIVKNIDDTHTTDTTHTEHTHTPPDPRPAGKVLKEYFVCLERKHHIIYLVRRR